MEYSRRSQVACSLVCLALASAITGVGFTALLAMALLIPPAFLLVGLSGALLGRNGLAAATALTAAFAVFAVLQALP